MQKSIDLELGNVKNERKSRKKNFVPPFQLYADELMEAFVN